VAIRLESPPVREPMVDKNGNITRNWARWLTLLHAKTGGSEAVLPVSLGGTGAASVVDAIANQNSSSTSSSGGGSASNASTQRKIFLLDSPGTNAVGDYADTVCTWDAAFPDATYTVTGEFSGASGQISIDSTTVTATGFTIRLTNTRDRQASGTADCIGVHP
jgi:hypothetical protein